MEEITVLEDGKIEVTHTLETKEVIDIEKLEEELNLLKSEPVPTDEDLLAHARNGSTHMYYSPQRLFRMSELEDLIKKYKQWQ